MLGTCPAVLARGKWYLSSKVLITVAPSHGATCAAACVAAPSGAVFAGTLDGAPVPWNASFAVKQGQELALGQVDTSTGIRGYLAVAGGIDVPLYLGSRSTFPNGNFGGYQGRCDTQAP